MSKLAFAFLALREQLPPRKYDRARIEMLEAENRRLRARVAELEAQRGWKFRRAS